MSCFRFVSSLRTKRQNDPYSYEKKNFDLVSARCKTLWRYFIVLMLCQFALVVWC